jgi:hypothetical protein
MNINLTKHKPVTTFGKVKRMFSQKNLHFTRGTFCSVIRGFA